jgi:uncharacterized caspase-like protein
MISKELPTMKPIERAKLLAAAGRRNAPQSPRVTVRALVIGINAYKDPEYDSDGLVKPGSGPRALDNAVSDAKAVHDALRSLPGAASTLILDCDRVTFEQALEDFRDSTGQCKDRGMVVKAATPNTSASDSQVLGIIFFAGHGIALDNANYLLPADWRVPNANKSVKVIEDDAIKRCISVSAIEKMLSQTSMFAGVVLLDCCRNVPNFKGLADREAAKNRGAAGTRDMLCGLAEPVGKKLNDLLVVFATAPGSTAADQSTRMPEHSPFTAALLKTFTIPALPLRELGEKLKDEVEADTARARDGPQTPYVSATFSSKAGGAVFL